jgi:hypothetical protein
MDAVAGVLDIAEAVGHKVPVVGELLQLSSMLVRKIESMEHANVTLEELSVEVSRVDETAQRFDEDGMDVNEDIKKKLDNLKLFVMDISSHAEKWTNKSTFKKYLRANNYQDKFRKDRLAMVACLNSLDRAVAVDTNRGVKQFQLAQEDMSKRMAENFYITASEAHCCCCCGRSTYANPFTPQPSARMSRPWRPRWTPPATGRSARRSWTSSGAPGAR